MKKKIFGIVMIVALMMCLTACDYSTYDFVDTCYGYNYAYISMPNGECVEGTISSWTDFEDGDQLQIEIDGVTYLTDTTRAVLVYKK